MDRLNLLCCDAASGLDTVHCSSTKQAGALTTRVLHALSVEEESRRMLPHFLLTSSIYRGLIRIWPIWRNPHQYTPDHPGVCDDVNLKTLVQTRMGDINGDERFPDQRFSIWFSNNVHRSSRNKYAECRINSRPIFLRSNLPI